MAPRITEELRFADEVASGHARRALAAVRDRLIVELAEAPTRYVSGLVKVLLGVLKDLDGLPRKRERTLEDELDERRVRREGLTARGEVRVNRQGGRTKEEYPRRSGDPKKQA